MVSPLADYVLLPCPLPTSSHCLQPPLVLSISLWRVKSGDTEHFRGGEGLIQSGDTVKPPIKDTPKEDKPPNKGQAKSTLVYTLYTKSPLKENNLSTKDKTAGPIVSLLRGSIVSSLSLEVKNQIWGGGKIQGYQAASIGGVKIQNSGNGKCCYTRLES